MLLLVRALKPIVPDDRTSLILHPAYYLAFLLLALLLNVSVVVAAAAAGAIVVNK